MINHFSEKFKDLFPKEIQVYTSHGTFKYKMGDFTREGDIVRVVYHGCSAENTGDVLSDGEPDYIGFDIHFTNNNNGKKTLVDVTYGDHIVSEFSIEAPNKVSVIHYDGVGSKSDSDTHFGFDDKSLQDIVNLFNKFDKSYKLSTKDFTFIDKYPDTYDIKESAKISPISENQTLLIVDNSNPETHKYVNNLLNYLRIRGINNTVVRTKEDIKKVNKDIVGVILSGSEYKVNQNKSDINDYVLDNLKCPILGICFGFQSICKHYGVDIKEGDKLIHEHRKLSKYRKHKLFDGLDVNKTQFSFSFNDYPTSCPNGFKVLSLIDNVISGVCNDSKKVYGLLFYPEDLERTHVVLDNFLSMCHHGQDEIESLKQGKFQIKNYKQFVESKKYTNMFYRNAKNSDYPDIKRISNQHRNYLPFVMRVAIEDSIKRNEVIVCEKDNRVIGFIHFHKRRDGYTTVHEIGVDKDFTSMGIGKSLINMIERPIQLKVTTDNPANEFYKKLGFKFIKEIKGPKRTLNLYILE